MRHGDRAAHLIRVLHEAYYPCSQGIARMSDVVEDGQIGILLSPERLGPFLAITGTEQDAIGLHNQALRLSAALMPVIALIEVALRNAACERLRTTLGVPNWLTAPPRAHLTWHGKEAESIRKAIAHAQRAAYAKLNNGEKKALDALAYPNGMPANLSRARRVRARQAKIQVGIGQTVAQLTLSFWKGLFSVDYEATLWKPVLRQLFPNKAIDRVQVAYHLEVIYEVRNRIAHREAVINRRLDAVLTSIEFITQNFGASRPSQGAILAQMIAPFRQGLDAEVAATRLLIARYSVGNGQP